MTRRRIDDEERAIILVLGGGNALGAYHGGGCEILATCNIEPKHVIGSSIGAITDAMIAGNPKADRVDRLCDV